MYIIRFGLAALALAVAIANAQAQFFDRNAMLKKLGNYPASGTIMQKTDWCQNAVIITRGQHHPETMGFAMENDTLTHVRDYCVRNNGTF